MEDDKIVDFAAKKAERNEATNVDEKISGAENGVLGSENRKVSVYKDGEAVDANEADLDPQITLAVQNPELNALIDKLAEESNPENFAALLSKLEGSRVLVPASLNDKKIPVPLTMKGADGELVQPIFTDKEKMEKAPQCAAILNLPFIAVLATVVEKGPDVTAIAINPMGKTVVIKRELLTKIMDMLNERATNAAVKMGEAGLPDDGKYKELLTPGRKMSLIKDGEVIDTNEADLDPQSTIEVKNPEVDALIDKFTEDKSNENLTALINQLEKSRVLLPGKLVDGKMPIPLTVNTADGEVLQPIFTDKGKMEKAPKSDVIINYSFAGVINTVLEKGPDISGIAINPFGKTVVFKRELVEKIREVMKQKEEALKAIQATPGGLNAEIVEGPDGVGAKIKFTESQYIAFERKRFESVYLPSKLYEKGQELIDRLSRDREVCVDEMFEESFVEKRMYPYLLDEFKVMFMGLTDELDVVSIAMPKRDMQSGIAETIFLSWNKVTKEGHYYAIVGGAAKTDRDILEVAQTGESKYIGEAPEEGTEINWLMSRLEGHSEENE